MTDMTITRWLRGYEIEIYKSSVYPGWLMIIVGDYATQDIGDDNHPIWNSLKTIVFHTAHMDFNHDSFRKFFPG